MSDERLTDAQLAAIAAAVAAYEGRYRWVQLSVDDVRALLDEVRRLRAERDALALRVDEMHRDMQQGSDAF